MPVYQIGGVSVSYPFKPYPSQISMMDRIIKALQRKQNSLLESPTGTGKTLALLCAALAWQREEKDKNEPDETPTLPIKSEPVSSTCSSAKSPAKKRPPRIYYGTRTHKQITQLVQELRRTDYDNVPMTILSSREHSCIHPNIKHQSNKNEMCKELLDFQNTAGCSYYQKLKSRFDNPASIRSVMSKGPNPVAFDVEDLTQLGEEKHFCPYFAGLRVLHQDAELIFCPYNYLIDPLVRDGLMLKLKDEILILDEAHNIEDSCRDAASFDFGLKVLREAVSEFELFVSHEEDLEHSKPLYEACSRLLNWVCTQLQKNVLKERSRNLSAAIWEGKDIVDVMQELQLTEDSAKQLLDCLIFIMNDDEVEEAEKPRGKRSKKDIQWKPSPIALKTIEKLIYFLGYLYKDGSKYVNDYRMCLTREPLKPSFRTTPSRHSRSGLPAVRSNWLAKASKDDFSQFDVTLHLWCMNPAVAFSDISSATRSIILASGTLSPMDTFQSELGLEFPLQLEAPHILPLSRSWVGSLSKGPNNGVLRATYTFTDTPLFNDELGQCVFQICRTVPHGVLCFFPSYRMLDISYKRWQETGLDTKLGLVKVLLLEPKSGDELRGVMNSFYDAIAEPANIGGRHCTGALLLAVCRGKISEGLDFSDRNARAVISVGIPYPNLKDLQVELKRDYNDRCAFSRKLLSGAQWYEIQAYRALNQALGRCLRHIGDWAALILIDERFNQCPKKYCYGLSKWVRQRITHYDNHSRLILSLEAFVCRLKLENEEDLVSTNSTQSPTKPFTTYDSGVVSVDGFKSDNLAIVGDTDKSIIVPLEREIFPVEIIDVKSPILLSSGGRLQVRVSPTSNDSSELSDSPVVDRSFSFLNQKIGSQSLKNKTPPPMIVQLDNVTEKSGEVSPDCKQSRDLKRKGANSNVESGQPSKTTSNSFDIDNSTSFRPAWRVTPTKFMKDSPGGSAKKAKKSTKPKTNIAARFDICKKSASGNPKYCHAFLPSDLIASDLCTSPHICCDCGEVEKVPADSIILIDVGALVESALSPVTAYSNNCTLNARFCEISRTCFQYLVCRCGEVCAVKIVQSENEVLKPFEKWFIACGFSKICASCLP